LDDEAAYSDVDSTQAVAVTASNGSPPSRLAPQSRVLPYARLAMSPSDDQLENVTYESFRHLASDESLSKYERIGFPDSYRAGFEHRIFEDITAKLSQLLGPPGLVVDIGPGCSDLPALLIET